MHCVELSIITPAVGRWRYFFLSMMYQMFVITQYFKEILPILVLGIKCATRFDRIFYFGPHGLTLGKQRVGTPRKCYCVHEYAGRHNDVLYPTGRIITESSFTNSTAK